MSDKKNIIIIGAGVSGMSAAKMLSSFDVTVHIIDKKKNFGGKAFEWACMATDTCQYCNACLAADMAHQVSFLENVIFYPETTINHVNKKNSDTGFEVQLKGKTDKKILADAILSAVGTKTFDPSKIDSFGYKDFDQVITTAELNAILKQDKLIEKLSGNAAPKIAFIQCVGSRSKAQNRDYCSQVCCRVAVRQANKILYLLPDSEVSIFHIDLQVISKEFRTQVKNAKERVNFFQGAPQTILQGTESALKLIKENEKTGEKEAKDFDLVVLSVGALSSDNSKDLYKNLGALPDSWGFFSETSSPLPKGIYMAGSAMFPTDIQSAIQQGTMAAYKIVKDFHMLPADGKKQNIAVIGKGIEGALAAKKLFQAGHNVSFLDVSPNKPNKPNKIDKTEEYDIYEDINANYFPESRIKSISGIKGDFIIDFFHKEKKKSLNVHALVAATGAEYLPLIKKNKNILTLSDYLKKFGDNHDNSFERIVFWLDHDGDENKASSKKVLQTLQQLVQNKNKLTVIMEKALVYGEQGQRIYDDLRQKGVKFLRSLNKPSVKIETNQLSVKVSEATLSGANVTVECDRLVIPEKLIPDSYNQTLSKFLSEPLDAEGFLQSPNVRHRPVEAFRQGIFFAGLCHDETDMTDIEKEMDLICALLETEKEELNDFPAKINKNRCVKCLTCFRLCPHGAVLLTPENRPKIVETACIGCGLCVSSCPEMAIAQEKSFNIQTYVKNTTVVFACKRSANLAALAAKEAGITDEENLCIIPVECASEIDETYLLNVLINGAKQVIVASCHKGNCRSDFGTDVAKARVEKIINDNITEKTKLRAYSVAANEPSVFAKILSGEQKINERQSSKAKKEKKQITASESESEIKINHDSVIFNEMQKIDGFSISDCLTCNVCNSACSWFDGKGAPNPRQMVRMAQLGLDDILAKSPMPWNCMVCNLCTVNCPYGIKMDAVVRKVRSMPDSADLMPKDVRAGVKTRLEMGDVNGFTKEDFVDTIDWLNDELSEELEGVEMPIPTNVKGAKFLYLPNPRELGTNVLHLTDMARMFNAFGESWTMSEKHTDVTNWGYFVGDDKIAATMAKQVVDAAHELEIETLVLSECGHAYLTYKVLLENLIKQKPKFKILSMPELTLKMVENGAIKLDGKLFTESFAYHDPCNIGRKSEQFEAPRKLLSYMCKDVVELVPSRNNGICCGGGGGMLQDSASAPKRMIAGKAKADQIKKANVKNIATACLSCHRQLTELVKHYDLGASVQTVVAMAAKALVK
jgi:heterodisulfide reductase subunit A-like polyferredoxin/Fe-S oxidoreductase/coenzyme F420-reducing hydrogenase delta subunit